MESPENLPLEEKSVRRAYRAYAPVYDLLFDWVFRPGRRLAVESLGIRPGDRVLEVGIGTGLNLSYYPRHCQLVGVDISEEMLNRARDRIRRLGLSSARARVMDATRLEFPDGSFDRAVATYAVSAVPEPLRVLQEMARVVRPGGVLVILNHFRSEGPVAGALEDLVAPICSHLGWKSNLALNPLLESASLVPDSVDRVNLFGGWRLVRITRN